MDVVGRLGRRDFTKDGLSVREEGLFPFSFHFLTRFALQGREGIRVGIKRRRSSYGHKESLKRKETLGLVGASERNKSKSKTDQGSFPTKPIGEGLKDGTCKGIEGGTNVNECKLHCPNMIVANNIRCYRGSKRGQAVTIEREWGNAYEAPAEREGLPGRMPMGVGFFKKARADLETWNLGLVINEGKLFELSPPAAYVVVGLIKLVKPCFPLPFTY
ncbi:hypothetical protein HAX54_019557 [Datura stramonium]|uniref:Uncharacterized protein n=1 Tax=Datura stramonium TaxID=4076 RepID=A0ABS8URK4_DATST|nr:hypothetical protein [Datura stramonium]